MSTLKMSNSLVKWFNLSNMPYEFFNFSDVKDNNSQFRSDKFQKVKRNY